MTRFSRRQFLTGSSALMSAACTRSATTPAPALVNDVHSRLNPTHVSEIVRPRSIADLQEVVARARSHGRGVCIAGGRHAMGGQQFAAGATLIDTTGLGRVLEFDPDAGQVEVEAGIQWPALIDHLVEAQQGRSRQWGVVQKQTGADRLCLGGALAANGHGRGLRFKPIVTDVESFALVGPDGESRRCSRQENPELFRLAIGGYGLFGCIASVRLRLAPRRKLQRVVEVIAVDDLMEAFERRISEGFLYGDCQYATDATSADFLARGVFSCYRPIDDRTPLPDGQRELSLDAWNRLLYLSHADKKRAFELYSAFYLSTSGQVYWSDTHQRSVYVDHYHEALDRALGGAREGDQALAGVTAIALKRSMDAA